MKAIIVAVVLIALVSCGGTDNADPSLACQASCSASDSCGLGAWPSHGECVSECLLGAQGLSSECIDCALKPAQMCEAKWSFNSCADVCGSVQ